MIRGGIPGWPTHGRMMQGFQLSLSSFPEAHTALGPEREFVRKVGVLRGRAAATSHRAETAPLA